MDVIKNILREELEDAENLLNHYQGIIGSLSKGNISVKKIKGREYPVLQYREGKKVFNKSLKGLPEQEREKIHKEVLRRQQLEKLAKETRRKINYLKKAINVK